MQVFCNVEAPLLKDVYTLACLGSKNSNCMDVHLDLLGYPTFRHIATTHDTSPRPPLTVISGGIQG